MIELIVADKIQEAAAIHRTLVPLVNAMFSFPSPAPIKYALNQLGFKVGEPRLPLVPVDETRNKAVADNIKKLMAKITIDIKV
jgi:4-hydroxy-tetrahydrodipicolinate synthase